MTPTEFVDAIFSACDPSNWGADNPKGAYYRGLHDAYTTIHEIAGEYQTAMYEWTRTRAQPQAAGMRDALESIAARKVVIHGDRLVCQVCGYKSVAPHTEERHAPNCARQVARDALALTRPEGK
jgi:hypothetical protein